MPRSKNGPALFEVIRGDIKPTVPRGDARPGGRDKPAPHGLDAPVAPGDDASGSRGQDAPDSRGHDAPDSREQDAPAASGHDARGPVGGDVFPSAGLTDSGTVRRWLAESGSAPATLEASNLPEPPAPRGQIPESAAPAVEPCSPKVSQLDRPAAAGPFPFLELVGPHARLSFTYRSGAIAAAAVLFLLFGAYQVGHHEGRSYGRHEAYDADPRAAKTAHDGIEAAQRKSVDPNALSGFGSSTPIKYDDPPEKKGATVAPNAKNDASRGAGSTPPSGGLAKSPSDTNPPPLTPSRGEQPVWVKGHTYVAVQHFDEAEADARAAQKFLKDNGIDSAIVRFGKGGTFTLMATKGFNAKDAAQEVLMNEFWQRIKALGRAYFKNGGGYRLEGQLMTLNRDQW